MYTVSIFAMYVYNSVQYSLDKWFDLYNGLAHTNNLAMNIGQKLEGTGALLVLNECN